MVCIAMKLIFDKHKKFKRLNIIQKAKFSEPKSDNHVNLETLEN